MIKLKSFVILIVLVIINYNIINKLNNLCYSHVNSMHVYNMLISLIFVLCGIVSYYVYNYVLKQI